MILEISISLLLLLVFFEKCTVINITSLFKKKEYDNYPYLYEDVTNTNFEIVRLSESPYHTIAYDEKKNYFIIYGDDEIRKINSLGADLFSLKKTDDLKFFKSRCICFYKK